MDLNELKLEAEEKCVCKDEAMRIMYGIGYYDGALPREKRIAELEAEVKEWKDKANLWCKTANLKDHNIMINKELEKENAELKTQVKTAYRKGMRHIAKALKDYDRTDGAWTDYFEHTVDKVLQREQTTFEEYGTLSDQLTNAKELLERLLITSCNSDVLNLLPNCSEVLRVRVEAEQFLKDCDINNAIQQANKGLDFDKIADEMEQDLKDSKVEK